MSRSVVQHNAWLVLVKSGAPSKQTHNERNNAMEDFRTSQPELYAWYFDNDPLAKETTTDHN